MKNQTLTSVGNEEDGNMTSLARGLKGRGRYWVRYKMGNEGVGRNG